MKKLLTLLLVCAMVFSMVATASAELKRPGQRDPEAPGYERWL